MTSQKARCDALREEMRGKGLTCQEIADEMSRRYGFRPREAYRHAYGWTLKVTAERFNLMAAKAGTDPDGRATMTAARLCEYEKWPHGSNRRPSVYVLTVLALLYDTPVRRLLDLDDHRRLPEEHRLVLARQSDQRPTAQGNTVSPVVAALTSPPVGSPGSTTVVTPDRICTTGHERLSEQANWYVTERNEQVDPGPVRPVPANVIRDEQGGAGAVNALSMADSPLDAFALVAKLSWQDMRRSNFLAGAGFMAAAFAQPTLYAMIAPAEPVGAAEPGRRRRVGIADVEALRDTVSHFQRLDQTHGGGRLRAQVVRILNDEVCAAQHATYSEKVGRELFRVLAELTCLAAYMTLDAGRHALAQRYYVQALSLSRHAKDRLLGSHVLGCMSFQATYLGHGRDGAALASAAQLHAAGRVTPGATAVLKALEARGHALVGDERAATVALSGAEVHLARSTPGEGPSWLVYFTSAELAAHVAHCLRDLGKPAQCVEPLVVSALDAYDPSCVRSRGFVYTVLATAHLTKPNVDVDAACGEADKALKIVSRVRSARSRKCLADFVQRLQPLRSEPVTQEFIERARPVLAPMKGAAV